MRRNETALKIGSDTVSSVCKVLNESKAPLIKSSGGDEVEGPED